MSTGALYVYAIVPARPAGAIEVAGLDGERVRAVTEAGLSAIVHDLAEARPYVGPDDQVRRWVSEHARVIEAAWEATDTILPMSFDVIARPQGARDAEANVRAWLVEQGEALRARLEALRGCVELRIDVSLERAVAAAGDAEVAAARAEVEAKPAGLRRLLERRLEQLERRAADHAADRLYPELRRRIAALAEDLMEHRRVRVAGGLVPVLAAAVLAPRDSITAIGAELGALQDSEPAARIRFLGPWPPYSFAQPASLGEAAAAGDGAGAGGSAAG